MNRARTVGRRFPSWRLAVGGWWFAVCGLRFVVRGSRFVVRGSWFAVRGSRFAVRGSWFAVRGSRFAVRGSWLVVRGSFAVTETFLSLGVGARLPSLCHCSPGPEPRARGTSNIKNNYNIHKIIVLAYSTPLWDTWLVQIPLVSRSVAIRIVVGIRSRPPCG